jgi:UDP-glucose 4-epimerase
MKKVLITGGLGFVGGRLCRALGASHEVTVSGRVMPSLKDFDLHYNPGFCYHRNLLDTATFPKDIDTVIHLAALNEWDCVKYPSEAIRVNIDETRIILENSISRGVRQFIYFSTAHVYGSPLSGAVDELVLPQPQHPYAITHKAAEDYVVAAHLQNKIKSVVVRLSNSFGAPVLPSVNRWTLLANDICRQAIEKGQIQLLSNGCQYRDFICLSDVERAVELMVDTEGFKKIIYNLGSGASLRVLDFAGLVQREYGSLYGQELPLLFPEGCRPSQEPELDFSIGRLQEEGFNPENNTEGEIRELLEFCAKHFSLA